MTMNQRNLYRSIYAEQKLKFLLIDLVSTLERFNKQIR